MDEGFERLLALEDASDEEMAAYREETLREMEETRRARGITPSVSYSPSELEGPFDSPAPVA